MSVESLRRLYEAKPFRPFILHLADGRHLRVEHPEFLAWAPTEDEVVLYQPDRTLNIVDLLLVTDLEVAPPAARPRRRN